MTRVGWIGLGAMGGPMAAVASAEHELLVFDLAVDAVERLTDRGVAAASSIAGAASGVGILAIMVATEAQVDAVLFGERGAAPELEAGATVVVMATVGPAAVERWEAQLAERGVALVDAPVSGGVARAGLGDLLIMVSGAPAAVAAVAPLLATLARSAPVVGDRAGDGQRVKLVNQLLCGVHIAAAAEALAFAESLGLDPRATWQTVRSGAAASFMLDDRGGRMLDAEFEPPLSAIDIFVKDMGLVQDAAAASSLSTPVAGAARGLYARAAAAGLGRKDDSVLIDVIRSEK